MKSRWLFVGVPVTAVLLAHSALAVSPTLSINGGSSPAVNTCVPVGFLGTDPVTLYGEYIYAWTLYRNGTAIQTATQTIKCDPPGPCQLPQFNYSGNPGSGTYKLKEDAKFSGLIVQSAYSNQITLTVASGPQAISRINGNGATNVPVCSTGPIMLDGSGSRCASSYFVSIELSDQGWNRKGGEFWQWLNTPEYNRYGVISSFNVKKWAEDHWFHFTPGQYYRVKVAVGPAWNENTQLIFITAPTSVLKINGSAAQKVDIVGPAHSIVIDGGASSCASQYFVSIQLSDANWGRHGPEAMRWLTSTDFSKYGPITNFNVKKFAEDQWFSFVPGQYYRVKLAIGPGWTETSTLIEIKP